MRSRLAVGDWVRSLQTAVSVHARALCQLQTPVCPPDIPVGHSRLASEQGVIAVEHGSPSHLIQPTRFALTACGRAAYSATMVRQGHVSASDIALSVVRRSYTCGLADYSIHIPFILLAALQNSRLKLQCKSKPADQCAQNALSSHHRRLVCM